MQMCVWGSTGTLAMAFPPSAPGSSSTQASSAAARDHLPTAAVPGWPESCPDEGSQAGFAAPAEASTAAARLLTASKLSLWKLACVFLHYRAAAKARLQCRHTLYLSDPKRNFI